jgi:tRNA A37 methylthiotransferase MiaB
MAESGWTFTDAEDADVTVVNTCGFVDAAKKDSVDALLAAADATPSGRVVAVGCMAERYGRELAEATTTRRSTNDSTTCLPGGHWCRTLRATAVPCCR